MKKRFTATLVIPVAVELIGEANEHGEITLTGIINAQIPVLSDITNAATDDNLAAIDEGFAESTKIF